MRTRIKICGITRLEDGQAAVLAGADAIGFVFFRDSPRNIMPLQAATIAAQLPPFVARVGLFVNPTAAEVSQVLAELSLDILQFQGDETPEFCRQFHRPYLKVLRVKSGVDVNSEISRYPDALGILLDTYDPNAYGGTGRPFDWSMIPAKLAKPLILAGGLTVTNVAQAIRAVRPYAVDVSSGVEASKGIKDHAKIRAFIDEVRSVDRG